jgi:8-oxo-dGTP diphosphatase
MGIRCPHAFRADGTGWFCYCGGYGDLPKTVRVGVSVVIRNGNFILLGKRLKSHGVGSWCTPGGHLEFGETPEQTARQEVMEETGLELGKISRSVSLPYLDTHFPDDDKQYITLYMEGEYIGGNPVAREPEKCASWEWFDKKALPSPLFTDMLDALDPPNTGFEAVQNYTEGWVCMAPPIRTPDGQHQWRPHIAGRGGFNDRARLWATHLANELNAAFGWIWKRRSGEE